MNVIRYNPWKLLVLAIVAGVPAALFMWMLVTPDAFMAYHGRYSGLVHFIADNFWASAGLFALTGGAALCAVSVAFGERIAVSFGTNGIEVQSLFKRHRLGWAEIAGISIARRGRTASSETLVVRVRRGDGEKSIHIGMSLLKKDRLEIERMLENFGRAPAPAAVYHDAAIARHLAARQGGGAPSAAAPAAREPAGGGFARPAARGGFGRKGL